jgi:hypothetical protein
MGRTLPTLSLGNDLITKYNLKYQNLKRTKGRGDFQQKMNIRNYMNIKLFKYIFVMFYITFSYNGALGANITCNTFQLTNNSMPANWYVNDASTANDVYTTAVGNDANPGTTSAPFATLTQALLVASAGDVIFVDAGTYLTVGAGVFYNVDKAITIIGPNANVDPRPCTGSLRTPGGASEAIFDGDNMTGAIFFIQSGDVEINGIEIRDATVNSSSRCINSNTTVKDNCSIKYCILGNSNDDAMQIQYVTNSIIEYNYIWNTLGAGDAINVNNFTNVDVQYNEIKSVGGSNGAIYVYGPGSQIDIRCNYIYDYYNPGGRMIRIGATGGVSNYTVEDNILETGFCLGIQLEQPNGMVSGNQIRDINGVAIELKTAATNVSITDNAIYNNENHGISIQSAVNASTVTISNNIIFDNGGFGLTNANANVVNADNNWWGVSDGPSGSGPGSGDNISTNVDAIPFLVTMPTATGIALALAFNESSGTANDGIISAGSQVDFTAPLGFSNYNFKVNNVTVQNGASNTFSSTTLGQSSEVTVVATGHCSGCAATSNEVVIYIDAVPPIVPTIRYVDPSGGNCGSNTPCYTDLQDALIDANNGDVIDILAGVITVPGVGFYFDINKELTIRGAQDGVDPRPCISSARVSGSASETIIDGNSITGSLFYIQASNVTVDGIEFRNSTARLVNSNNTGKSNIVVKNCILGGSVDDAIQIQDVSNSSIEYNYVQNTLGAGDGINISENVSNSTIQYNEITGVNNNNGVIYVYGPANNITIQCNKIYNCNGTGSNSPKIRIGATGGGSGFQILNNIITGCSGTGSGIRTELGGTTIQGNQIYENTMSGPGIFFTGTAAAGSVQQNAIFDNAGNGITLAANVVSTGVTVSNNVIYNNTGIGLQNLHATLTVNAENNWWGAGDGPSGAGPGSGDDISVRVDADPFLTAIPTATGLPPVLALTETSGVTTNDAIICAGGSVSFTATAGFTNYEFFIGAISAQSGASNVFTTTNLADNDEVIVVVTGHCSGCPVISDGVIISVDALPVVALALTDDDATICESPVTLAGESPAGGIFSGPSVSGSMINPLTAGIGTHIISYTYTDANICSNTASDNFTITGAGTPYVKNEDSGKYFCSIQSAINDAQTLAGHTLTVAPSTFSETVTVSKSLTINGANSGVNANSPADITMLNGARSVESILSATNIQVTAPNVTFDGFTFTGASGIHTNGVVANAADGLTMINNVFDNVPSSAYNNNSGATAQSNLIFSNNRVVGSNAAGISAINAWDGINNMLMNANYFAGFERGIQLDNASDITISNNYFTNISHHGLQVASSCEDVDITSNVFNNCNAMTQPDRGAIRLYSEVTGDINILNNIFTNNYNAVRLRSTGTFAHSYFNVNNNSFTTTANKAISDGTTGSTGFINGTCNWYGSTNAVTVASLIEENVTFEQYLSDGTDNTMATPGFQPVPGSCTGCTSGILAYNTNTMVSYCSFEDAIAAAGLTHTIELQIGSVTLAANLTMLSGQTLVIKNGTTLVNPINNILTNNGNFVLEPTGTFSNLGTFAGLGSFTGDFTNEGIFSPGN